MLKNDRKDKGVNGLIVEVAIIAVAISLLLIFKDSFSLIVSEFIDKSNTEITTLFSANNSITGPSPIGTPTPATPAPVIPTPVLMSEAFSAGNNFFTYNGAIVNGTLTTINFIPNASISDAIHGQYEDMDYIDVSEAQDESIVAVPQDAYTLNVYSESKFTFPEDCSYMFDCMSTLESIDLSNVEGDQIKSMSAMFSYCNNLKTITFGNKFTTPNLTDISAMVKGCKNLESIDFGTAFDTTGVTDFSFMLDSCNKLTSITVGPKFLISETANLFGFTNDECWIYVPNQEVFDNLCKYLNPEYIQIR